MKIKCFQNYYWKNETDVNDFIKEIYSNGGEVKDIKISAQNKISFVTIIYTGGNNED